MVSGYYVFGWVPLHWSQGVGVQPHGPSLPWTLYVLFFLCLGIAQVGFPLS